MSMPNILIPNEHGRSVVDESSYFSARKDSLWRRPFPGPNGSFVQLLPALTMHQYFRVPADVRTTTVQLQ
jgi:hypothetical protein